MGERERKKVGDKLYSCIFIKFFDLLLKLPICHSGLDPESSDTSGLPNSNYRICPIILIIRCQVAVPDSQFVDMV